MQSQIHQVPAKWLALLLIFAADLFYVIRMFLKSFSDIAITETVWTNLGLELANIAGLILLFRMASNKMARFLTAGLGGLAVWSVIAYSILYSLSTPNSMTWYEMMGILFIPRFFISPYIWGVVAKNQHAYAKLITVVMLIHFGLSGIIGSAAMLCKIPMDYIGLCTSMVTIIKMACLTLFFTTPLFNGNYSHTPEEKLTYSPFNKYSIGYFLIPLMAHGLNGILLFFL